MDRIEISLTHYRELMKKSSTKWEYPITLSCNTSEVWYSREFGVHNMIEREYLDLFHYTFLNGIIELMAGSSIGGGRFHITTYGIFLSRNHKKIAEVLITKKNVIISHN